jgi:hypothetical protein
MYWKKNGGFMYKCDIHRMKRVSVHVRVNCAKKAEEESGGEEEKKGLDVAGDTEGLASAASAAAVSDHFHDTTRVLRSESMQVKCYGWQ